MAEQNNSYPMISEKNWWTIRNKFKASLPSTVTTNYIKTLLSLSSNASATSNVISPLKRLGLIDDDGKPTPLANDWRLEDKYADACERMIKHVYPRELLDLFPEKEVDKSSAESWFMSQGAGQGASYKMSALFILLKSGEIKEQKPSQKKAGPTKTKAKAKEVSKPTPSENNQNNNTPSVSAEKGCMSSGQPNLHIDLQIHISPESTPEQIEAIFSSMAKHLYGANN